MLPVSARVRKVALAVSYRGDTMVFTVADARSGWPEANGGLGSYSRPSWMACATGSPAISATTWRPKSIPDVTPPAVITFPSSTTRPFLPHANLLAPNDAAGTLNEYLRQKTAGASLAARESDATLVAQKLGHRNIQALLHERPEAIPQLQTLRRVRRWPPSLIHLLGGRLAYAEEILSD
jgi:hypothetical protein